MDNTYSEKWYSLKDLNRAFNMGLESAVFILENAEGLTPNGIKYLTESLKKIIEEEYTAEQPFPLNVPREHRNLV